MSYSSTHHSFSIELAIKYKMEKAAIIHHLQHWIKLNRRKKSDKNFVEGRWWTYQTLNDLADYLPYMSSEEIKYHMEQLVELGVIIKGKHNKSKIDKTTWYAFRDEALFLGEEDSNNPYERENSLSTGKIPSPSGKIPSPIPDPKSSDPKTTDKEIHKEGSSTPPSADAEGLFELFLSKIKERNPGFKDPNRAKWILEMDRLLRLDHRDLEKTKEIILWASTHKWFKNACLSPGKLKKDYDSMLMQMESGKEEDIVVKNRQFALAMKEKYPEQMKSLFFDKNFVGNRATGKEIPFKLPFEQFKDVFITLFGGQYVR